MIKRLAEPEGAFEINGEYIAEQVREAVRVFLLPIRAVAEAASAVFLKIDIARTKGAL